MPSIVCLMQAKSWMQVCQSMGMEFPGLMLWCYSISAHKLMKNNYGIGGNACFIGKDVGASKLHVEGQHGGNWMERQRFWGHWFTQNKRSSEGYFLFVWLFQIVDRKYLVSHCRLSGLNTCASLVIYTASNLNKCFLCKWFLNQRRKGVLCSTPKYTKWYFFHFLNLLAPIGSLLVLFWTICIFPWPVFTVISIDSSNLQMRIF